MTTITYRIILFITAVIIALPVVVRAAGPLEEIVVTATKRTESIQDVSIAVSAFSGDRLRDAHILDIEDLQFIAPSVTVGNDFGTAQLFMRGLGQNSILNSIDPSVGLYVDGAVINAPAAQLFSFFDLERIEVSRGPQGTLFGRNTTGGAINLITAKPTEELEGYARVSAGKYSLVETEGALSGPLLENKVLGRVAWKTARRDGFGDNEFTGNDVDDLDQLMFRSSFQFNINDRMDFLLTGEYGEQSDRSFAFKFQEVSFPEAQPGDNLFAQGTGGFPTGGPRNVSMEFDPSNERETWSVTGTFNWQMTDNVLFRSITNYRDIDVDMRQDIDLSSVANRRDSFDPDARGNSTVTQQIHLREQFSQELQLHYNGDFMGKRVDAVAGYYFFDEDAFFANRIGTFPDRGRQRVFPDGSLAPTDPRVKLLSNGDLSSHSVFWNVRVGVIEGITLKAGGRWTRDEREVVNENQVFVPRFAPPCQAQFPLPDPPEVAALRPGVVECTIFPPGFDDNKNFTDYTTEIGLEWRPDFIPDALLYYTFSEGFKAGTAPGGTTNVTDFVDPEEITNHEFGLKSIWLNGTLRLNIAGFFYDIDGLQLQVALPAGPANFVTVFSDDTSQEAHGIEVEADWAVTDRLRLSGALAWLDAEFINLLGVDPLDPGVFDQFAGNEPRRSPEWSGNIRAAYDLPVSEDFGRLTVSAEGSFKDNHFFDEFNNHRLSEGAYWLLDARLRYRSPSERWSFEVWGKNLTNELVRAENRALGTGRVVARTFLEPVAWGVTLGFNY